MHLDPNLESLGRLLERLGQLLECLGRLWRPTWRLLEPLGRLLEPTWELLGVSWAQLGASRIQLGASWEPLGLHLALPTDLQVQLGLHLLPLPAGLLLYFMCTAQGATKFNNTSFVVPQGQPSATEEHCQRSSLSMESTGAD